MRLFFYSLFLYSLISCSSQKSTIKLNDSFKIVVNGIVTNSKGEPIDANLEVQDLSTSRIVERPEITNGKFSFSLTSGKLYGWSFQKKGYYTISKNFDTRSILKDYNLTQEIQLRTIEEILNNNETVQANNLFFSKGGIELLTESKSEIDEITRLMKLYTKLKIEVIGHASSEGEVEYNNKLSEYRANSVLQSLIINGIDSVRLSSIGMGTKMPIAPNDIEENRQKNRRVELLLSTK
ncbi:MAG: OmpA family protein [Chlorobi bacterium]|nr:OmpA family protein [Chlorobiota bacterium]